MSKNNRLTYKAKKRVLCKRQSEITDEETKSQIELLLSYNDKLRQAYEMKEWFYEINDSKSFEFKKEQFSLWLETATQMDNPHFKEAAKTLSNWSKYIVNSFKYNLTNGPIEGTNNKIKVMKRNAYGFQNFESLRKKILYILG